eukprot:5353380-Amphidinium_carterae.1
MHTGHSTNNQPNQIEIIPKSLTLWETEHFNEQFGFCRRECFGCDSISVVWVFLKYKEGPRFENICQYNFVSINERFTRAVSNGLHVACLNRVEIMPVFWDVVAVVVVVDME